MVEVAEQRGNCRKSPGKGWQGLDQSVRSGRSEGCLDGSVAVKPLTLDFGSGRDLMVPRQSSVLGAEPA